MPLCEPAMLWRIDDVDAAAEHGDGDAARPRARPRCAAESTPRAMPLTTVTLRRARSAPSRRATSSAYGDAAREPTMATEGACRTSTSPLIQSLCGGSWMAARAVGKRTSPRDIAEMCVLTAAPIAQREPAPDLHQYCIPIGTLPLLLTPRPCYSGTNSDAEATAYPSSCS